MDKGYVVVDTYEFVSHPKRHLFAPQKKFNLFKGKQEASHYQTGSKTTKQKKKSKMAKFIKQKDDIITLILLEMKQENGSLEAIQNNDDLKNYQNSKLVNCVKYFRRFGTKSSQCSSPSRQSTKTSTSSKQQFKNLSDRRHSLNSSNLESTAGFFMVDTDHEFGDNHQDNFNSQQKKKPKRKATSSKIVSVQLKDEDDKLKEQQEHIWKRATFTNIDEESKQADSVDTISQDWSDCNFSFDDNSLSEQAETFEEKLRLDQSIDGGQQDQSHMDEDSLRFSEVFGMMIEDAVATNKKFQKMQKEHDELDPISEKSIELSRSTSLKSIEVSLRNSLQKSQFLREQKDQLWCSSVLDTIPSEISGKNSLESSYEGSQGDDSNEFYQMYSNGKQDQS